MFGYTRAEALGQDLTIIIPPPYKAEHRGYVRRYVATREARMIGKHARLSAQHRDGREFPISISFSVAEIRDNLYFTGIIRDITEYKEHGRPGAPYRTPGRGGQYHGPHRP